MRNALLIALLLPICAFSQGLEEGEVQYDYPNFAECGLITRWASNKIPANCLTEVENATFDEDLSLSRRLGSSLYTLSPCTDNKYIKGMWNFNALDGQRYIVINSSNSLFYTKTRGDCTKITGTGVLNSASKLECVQSLGKLHCLNGVDTGFYWTGGAGVTANATMPLGTKIGAFRNRIVVAGMADEPTRIRMSAELDATDWTVDIPGTSDSPVSIDIAGLEDGNKTTAILGQYQNSLYLGREYDLWQLSGNDRRDFTLRNVSQQVGVLDSNTVQEKDNCKIWLSHRGIEKLCGTTINRASDAIRPLIDNIIKSGGTPRSKTYTSQADWQTGNSTSAVAGEGPTSTTIYPGSVVPSTWGAVVDSSVAFAEGTLVRLSSTDFYNTLSIEYPTVQQINAKSWTQVNPCNTGFTTLDVNNLRMLSGGGAWCRAVRSTIDVANAKATYTNTIYITGFSNEGVQSNPTHVHGTSKFYFVASTTNSSTMNGYSVNLEAGSYNRDNMTWYLRLKKYTNGSAQTLASSTCGEDNLGGYRARLDGDMVISVNSGNFSITHPHCTSISVYDNTYIYNSGYTFVDVAMEGNSSQGETTQITNFYGPTEYSSGTYTSKIFDTGFSTPVWGTFEATDNAPTGSTITYSVRISTSPNNDMWGGWVVTGTETYKIPNGKRYGQVNVDFSKTVSSAIPVLNRFELQATATGYYITDCVNTEGAYSYGNFRPATVISGDSSFSYAVSTGTTCHSVTRATATWNAQLPNSPVVLSTAPFLGIRVFANPVTSTDTLRLNGLTQEWQEGAVSVKPTSVVYRDRYYLFITTSTLLGEENDSALVLDMNDKWTAFTNIYAASAVVYENKLFTGDSRNGDIYQQDIGDSNNGSNFRFYAKTADFDFGNPVEKKLFKRLYLTLKGNHITGQLIGLNVKYYVNGSTTAYDLGQAVLSEDVETGYFIAKFPQPNNQHEAFNWLSLSIEYDGSYGPLSVYGIKLVYRPIRWE